MELRITILWIHALAGAGWVAACVCFVIAGLALTAGSDEQRTFALRAAPQIDRFNLAAALTVVLSGAVNLGFAGLIRRFSFSLQFGLILAIKVILFIGMSIALGRSLRIAASLGEPTHSAAGDAIATATNRMIKTHGAIAAMGGVALLLGLWLMGS